MEENFEKLIELALKAREKSYSPYSHFKVGAALLAEDGSVYSGCNIENASYAPTNCAERTAFFKAVSEGKREFKAIAIVGGMAGETSLSYCAPCGVCRQVMIEFCDPKEFKVIVAIDEKDYHHHTLEEILPFGFGPKDLKHRQ